ncbi:metal transporter [Kovacikia minuta CCNUW1]|uniref:ZIP family metal transporter n=1 Tax=Kovacikia minuta TaxID=2931930 RepID=UPI001CC9B169|nr:metal transporter [Kovacikia minuta]UBF26722.1 metal transporter [Kovacikia minuta CCNUW1]
MKRAGSWVVLPLVALILAIGIFLGSQSLAPPGVLAPPLEKLTVEQTVLDDQSIWLLVRARGTEPVQIAQVQVDGSYWEFRQEPAGSLPRLATAWLRLHYPWVSNETHHIILVTNTGATFEHTIDAAQPTPQPSLQRLPYYSWLGLCVGILPVALGMLFYPYLRTVSGQGMKFLLALTLGMLAFLLINLWEEGLKVANKAATPFLAGNVVWLVAGFVFLILLLVERRTNNPSQGTSPATKLALNTGLHNLGGGLAIGTSFASGEAPLGSLLMIGFALHNINKGIGIATPLAESYPKPIPLLKLIALAGLPAVLGTWIGAFAFSSQWVALFFGIGVGVILKVMVEVGSYLMQTAQKLGGTWLSQTSLAGFCLGLVVMYGMALLVNV